MPSPLLPSPVSIRVDTRFLSLLATAHIATTWDIEDFDRQQGWLSECPKYIFRCAITIEGPCAFYGGLYGPNPWTAEGGLCTMGAASYSHSPLPEGIVVGRYCSIGKGLRFLDFAHPTDWVSTSVAFFRPKIHPSTRLTAIHNLIERGTNKDHDTPTRHEYDPRRGLPYPTIEHDVWIGENATLAMGITIGTGAIIAAGSTVTHDVPPYTIVAGAPAQVKRLRFAKPVTQELLASEWWQYSYADLQALDIRHPESFLGNLAAYVDSGAISVWQPTTLRFPSDLIQTT